MRREVILAVFAIVIHSRFADAACAPGRSFCEALPDRSNANAAILLGRVKEMLPAPPLVVPSSPTGSRSSGVANGRRLAGEPVIDLPNRYPVARLDVVEAFSGPVGSAEFDVRLTSDHFVNSEPVQVLDMRLGEVWLIEAYRSTTDNNWYTSSCQRSRRESEADREVAALRKWAAGNAFQAHFSARVFDRSMGKYVAGVRVDLRNNKTFSAISDSEGRFLIDNLPPAVYEALTNPPMNGGPLRIDLTKSWCADRTVVLQ